MQWYRLNNIKYSTILLCRTTDWIFKNMETNNMRINTSQNKPRNFNPPQYSQVLDHALFQGILLPIFCSNSWHQAFFRFVSTKTRSNPPRKNAKHSILFRIWLIVLGWGNKNISKFPLSTSLPLTPSPSPTSISQFFFSL